MVIHTLGNWCITVANSGIFAHLVAIPGCEKDWACECSVGVFLRLIVLHFPDQSASVTCVFHFFYFEIHVCKTDVMLH